MKTFFLLLLSVLGCLTHLSAQGVTTGSISGRVTDAKTGTGLSGATVVVVQVSSGSRYGAVARKNGSFRISGVRIGGDYRVTATFVGYATSVRENVGVSAGENTDVTFALRETNATTQDVVITATQDAVFQQSKNGSGTSLSEAEIQATPSINRSLSDIARVNPYASQTTGYGSDDGLQGISIAGSNSRYNNIQIDGAVANDMFGLGQAGTAGSQANANVVSMDAIQELQVNVSPYDVRQSGFTGAVVNAVTRSGSNRTAGSVYTYGRNQLLVGRSPDAARAPYPSFNDYQFGGRIGGAIIPSTLFYHVTAETRQRTRPLELGINNPAMINNFPHTQSEIDEIRSVAKESFGYDAGSGDPFTSRNNTYNVLARFDWNMNEN
ncbi:MAG: carboxypeptidase regulatory-like domain-containing protein, partial [Candidatus Kapaibacterium sp.]